ncbi:hypothetical protein ONB67_00820 [Candidatus Vidania fulgoroideae]|uniref:Uncharacterized protein n=1 Tax=Candidatus Vidania fulgoroideorum TaxID=881286 RepID=A0AAX3N9N5_9PROT|nr:hypothetical protein ONB67_00820 [Candidatus Vidania fulgoroideae]
MKKSDKILSYLIKDYLNNFEKNKKYIISFGNNKTIEYLFKKKIIENKKNYIFNSKNLNKKFKKKKKNVNNIDLHIGFINLNLKNFYVSFGNKNFFSEKFFCKNAKKRIFFLKNSKKKNFFSEINLSLFHSIKKFKNIGIESKFVIDNKGKNINSNNCLLLNNTFKNEKDVILYNFFKETLEVYSNSYFSKEKRDIVYYVSDYKISLNKSK